jgi:salicylate hydroxylase
LIGLPYRRRAMAEERCICVIGAGIAGLTAALCLAEFGFRVVVVERSDTLSEAGAGLQLSPNATRILTRIGLTDDLAALWHEPDAIQLVSGPTLKPVASVPLGQMARARWGSPYAVLRRADLQRILAAHVTHHPLCRLQLGVLLGSTEPRAMAQQLSALCGGAPHLIVGADGVWSTTRSLVPGATAARYTGDDAWRATMSREMLAGVIDPSVVTAFLGPAAHLVAYPMVSTGAVNLVALARGARGAQAQPGWSTLANEPTVLQQRFAAFDARLTALFKHDVQWRRWPLFTVGDGAWHTARGILPPIVLIGDAAHAMTPYAAQGAAMAIEDASRLAASCASSSDDLHRAAADFAAQRKPRVRKVAARAAFNRFAYHARGPIRLGRDVVLSLRSADSLAADFDWLYGA